MIFWPPLLPQRTNQDPWLDSCQSCGWTLLVSLGQIGHLLYLWLCRHLWLYFVCTRCTHSLHPSYTRSAFTVHTAYTHPRLGLHSLYAQSTPSTPVLWALIRCASFPSPAPQGTPLPFWCLKSGVFALFLTLNFHL
jgi:hypothetical protein